MSGFATASRASRAAVSFRQQGLSGAVDPVVAAVSRVEARALITRDLDFANIRAYPPDEHAGVIALRLTGQGIDGVLDTVARLAPQLDEAKVRRHLWIVDEVRIGSSTKSESESILRRRIEPVAAFIRSRRCDRGLLSGPQGGPCIAHRHSAAHAVS
jgi:hypothetical protein